MHNNKLLSIEQTAERLGLRPPTIRAWVAQGRVARVKLGSRVLVPATEIERLIRQNTTPAVRNL